MADTKYDFYNAAPSQAGGIVDKELAQTFTNGISASVALFASWELMRPMIPSKPLRSLPCARSGA